MKRSKIFNIILCLFLVIAVERFCRWQTGGFLFTKATTAHVYPFSSTPQVGPSELHQTFYFLGSGVQSYAFLGEDGKTVIKLFKHHHMGLSTDLMKKLLPQAIATPILRNRENRMKHIFKSAQIAFEELPEETGVYYTHLGKTDCLLGQITLCDKIGIFHQLDLDQTEFVLQKRAEPVCERLHILFRSKKTGEAMQAMQNLLTLIENRSRKGIKNKDGKVTENCGFIRDTPIELDIGSYAYRSRSTNPDPHKKAVLKATLQLLHWVKINYPENLQQCRKCLLDENLD